MTDKRNGDCQLYKPKKRQEIRTALIHILPDRSKNVEIRAYLQGIQCSPESFLTVSSVHPLV